jgi:hypothetical protein
MASRPTETLAHRAEIVPAVDGIELLLVAAVGAASLSLRVVLDAVDRATRRPPGAPSGLARAAFAGLALGLVAARSVAQTAEAGLRFTERATAAGVDAMPGILRSSVEGRVAAIRERTRARDRELAAAELVAEDLVASLVPRIVSAALDQLDLTPLVVQRVDVDEIVRGIDLDAIVERIDVDAVAATLDVEALVERIDLAGLAQTVINEIDLPEIIRRSTGLVASETVRGVRMQGVEADRAIAGVVDRVLRRRRPRTADADPPADEADPPDPEHLT